MAIHLDSRKVAFTVGWILTITIGIFIGRQTNAPDEGAAAPSAPQHPWANQDPGAGSLSRTSNKRETDRPSPETSAGLYARSTDTLADTLAINDRLSRTRRMLDFVDTLSTDEFHDVVEAFRADGLASLRKTEYHLLLNAWVKADPYAAAEYVDGNDTSGSVRETIIASWAATDPQSAAAWIEGRPDEGGKNNWMVGLIHGLASNDPSLALEAIEALEPGKTRSSSMQEIFPFVIKEGFEYAGQWVAGISDENLQRGTARHLGRQLTRVDPAKAGTWVADMQAVSARRDASEDVSDEWARRDLESARVWAESLPEDTRTEAAEGVARHMAREDPARTADWLNSLGNNPDLDGARRIFLMESTRQAPDVAIEHVATLSNPKEQAKMYGYILKNWNSQDREATQSWVYNNATTLPDNLVKYYLRPDKK